MTANTGKRILLVEDDASMRKFIEIILVKADYDVTAAEDGLTAMQLAADRRFDAVVADVIMPNLSGYELCRMIRAKYAADPIPCIVLSGLEENTNDSRFCDAFLMKDTNLKEKLLEILRELLQGDGGK